MTWKTAIAKSWKYRGRHHIVGALIVSSVCGILTIIQSGVGKGLVIWIVLASVMFAIHIVDDARLQRKESRREARRVSA